MQQHEEGVPGSRCFVVCGKAITSEELEAAFSQFGEVQAVKVVRDKGVAYVRFSRASMAALAIENLNGAVLNDGRGPKLKVLLAEAPSSRGLPQAPLQPELELSSDPDNLPPRSRLFIVVPKLCEPQQIQEDLGQFPDLEYCKTDLAAARGVVFCKFSKSSSALKALEAIADRGMKVAGYTVKAMLAEPKTKRVRQDAMPPPELMYGMQQGRLDYGSLGGMDPLKQLHMNGAGLGGHNMGMGLQDFAAIGGLSGLGAAGIGGFGALGGNMNGVGMNNLTDMHGLALMGNLGQHMHNSVSPVSSSNLTGVPLSKQRLFVVVHKGVMEDAISRLFRRFPGMEYCDLKKDKTTGKSKGYCYVNYSTPDAAASAVEQLNGIEFPPHSGHRIKVMFAEPLGVRGGGMSATASTAGGAAGPFPGAFPGHGAHEHPHAHAIPGSLGGSASGGALSHGGASSHSHAHSLSHGGHSGSGMAPGGNGMMLGVGVSSSNGSGAMTHRSSGGGVGVVGGVPHVSVGGLGGSTSGGSLAHTTGTATSAPTPTMLPSSSGGHSSASASLPSRSPGVLSMHGGSMQMGGAHSAANTPLSRSVGTVSAGMAPITPDTVASVTDSLAGMSLRHIAAATAGALQPPGGVGVGGPGAGMGPVGSGVAAVATPAAAAGRPGVGVLGGHEAAVAAAAAHLTSPVAPAVARELMFNVN